MTVTPTSPVVCPVALELSRSTWLVGVLPPDRSKVTSFAVRGGDAQSLLERLRAIADRLAVALGRGIELKVGFEAGFDGFWLARFLLQRGIDTVVLDSSSFLVSRRGRRVKTDRIDVEAIAYILRAHSLVIRQCVAWSESLHPRRRMRSDSAGSAHDSPRRRRDTSIASEVSWPCTASGT
jgi:transposase